MEGKLNIFYNEEVKPIEQRIEDKETDCANDPVKLQVMRIHNEDRVFQNDRLYYDEAGQRIASHIVYKDFVSITITYLQMTFFTLHPKDIFGGRVVLLKNDLKPPGEELDTIEELVQMKKRESKRDQGTLSVVSPPYLTEL